MKIFSKLTLALLWTQVALAQTQAIPNETPVPSTAGKDLSTFLGEQFNIFIRIIAAIAVLVIAYWGLRYMLSSIPGVEKWSKERVWAAILGLLLALSAYLILQTINPDINNTMRSFLGG